VLRSPGGTRAVRIDLSRRAFNRAGVLLVVALCNPDAARDHEPAARLLGCGECLYEAGNERDEERTLAQVIGGLPVYSASRFWGIALLAQLTAAEAEQF
jgi:hypothetical protein